MIDIEILPPMRQSQESLDVQLRYLWEVANRLGLYDAGDFLRDNIFNGKHDLPKKNKKTS
jgi:predicted heme/steroid binding protein